MRWSRFSLSGKLFVAVVLPVLFALVLMAGAVAWSMRSGFTQYVLDADLDQFAGLARSLEQHPEAAAGWPSLSAPRAWQDLLAPHARRPPRPPGPAAGGGPPPPPRGKGPGPGPGHVRPLDRLSLLAPDGTLIAGRPGTSTAFADRPLRDASGQPLGTLRLSHLGRLPQPADSAFLAHQFQVISVTAVIALICASLVAWLVAQQSLLSIRQIGNHVARLAKGDLSSRLNSTREDELGRMMRDHDALAESLDAARTRERRWISDTSHELKTPLAILRAQIEALQDGIRTASPETLDSMHHAVMRLSRLTDDLSLLSRSDEGRLLQTPVPVDCCALLHDAARDARPAIEAAGLKLETTSPRRLIVMGDPVRLRQVLDNLLDNACRYTDAPGRLLLSCERAGDAAQITVSDTGPSPPADTLPQLFDRFRRGETSRARSHGGSGLGLAICRSLIEAHGGTITARPSDIGGLTIRILLPLTE